MTQRSTSKTAKSLFLEALELPRADRGAFLGERCGGDAGLRARVEALLAAHEGAPAVLGIPTDEAPLGEASGEVIGRYKLLQKIGEGGFGSVWMAEQQEPVRRKVALKIIKLGMDTRQVIARFEAERQALALMDHPNIAKVLDAGATESGRPFFVMELVRGLPITEYCDKARLSTAERLRLFIDVCQAVQHAHQKGIIHRDIKPSNVLVTLNGGKATPLVIDFGIAKATNQSLTEKTLFTEFRQFVGTPQYMSPEQAEISGLDVDTRADIYSLGVLLYELLTGTTPFDPDTLRTAAYDEILRIVREVNPPRPSTRLSTLGDQRLEVAVLRGTEPRSLRRLVSGDLDWIVMKALEKERTRRYSTAAGLAQDVARYLAHEPVVARPPSTAYRLWKFVERNRAAVLAGSVVVVALLIGAGAAAAGFVEARAEAKSAVAINDFFTDMLGSIDPQQLRRHSGFASRDGSATDQTATFARDVSVAEMLRRAGREIRTSFAGKPELETKARETIGVTLLGLGLPDDAAGELRTALDLRRDLSGERDPETLRTQLLLGAAVSAAGDDAEAEALVRPCFARMRAEHGAEDARTLHAASLLGSILASRGEYEEAGEILTKTLASQRRVLGTDHRDTLQTLCNLTTYYHWKSDGFGASEYAREAYEISRRTLGPDDFLRACAESNMGWSLALELDFERGEALQRSALATLERIGGERQRAVQLARLGLALCLRGEEHAAEREQLLRDAVEALTAVERNSPLLNVARRNLAMHLFDRQAFDEAITLARTNVAACNELDGERHPRTHEAVVFLGDGLRRAGRLEEAEAVYRECVRLRKNAFGDSPNTCYAWAALTDFYLGCGRLDDARATWQESLDLRRRLSLRPEADAEAVYFHGWLLLHPEITDMRDAEAALTPLRRAVEMSRGTHTRALADLALACRLTGRDEEAAATTRRLVEASRRNASAPDADADALMEYALLLLSGAVEDGDEAAAVDFAGRAVAASAGRVDALQLFAVAAARAGERDAAHAAEARRLAILADRAEAALATAPDLDARAWALACTPFEDLRDAETLAGVAERLRGFAGGSPRYLDTLGLAECRAGHFAEAIDLLERARTAFRGVRSPHDPAVRLGALALCYARLGEESVARELLAEGDAALAEPELPCFAGRELATLLSEARGALVDVTGSRVGTGPSVARR